MRFDDLMIQLIENYVNNEIEYIEGDLNEEEQEKCKSDLEFLDSLTIDDYNNIYDNIQINSDLVDEINETIHEYLYQYKNEKRDN